MQAEHVSNFGLQFNQGRLFAAGPLGDNGFIRGIVVLNVTNSNDIKDCFKTNPFIQNGILEAESHPWLVDLMKFGAPVVPFHIAQHTLCIVKKGRNWKTSPSPPATDTVLRLFPGLKHKAVFRQLAISGPFLDDGEKLGVLVFYSTNLAAIKAELDKEPAVAEGAPKSK